MSDAAYLKVTQTFAGDFSVCNYCLMYITAMQGRFDLTVIWTRHLDSLLGVYGIACLS